MFTPKVTKANKRNFDDIQSPDQPPGPTMFTIRSPHENKNKPTDRRIKLDHRTSLSKLCNVNSTLRDEQRNDVESMGFSSILSLQVSKIDLTMMLWLLNNFDPSNRVLNINGTKINITIGMVKSALGIPCSGKKIPINGKPNIGRISYGILFKNHNDDFMNVAQLEQKVQNSIEVGPNFKILYMMLLCTTLLLPKYGNSLDFEILEYLVDLTNIHTYNWGELVLDRLVEGVEKYKGGNTTVTGCIFLLQVLMLTYSYIFLYIYFLIFNNMQ